jgi:hypothetical protein
VLTTVLDGNANAIDIPSGATVAVASLRPFALIEPPLILGIGNSWEPPRVNRSAARYCGARARRNSEFLSVPAEVVVPVPATC